MAAPMIPDLFPREKYYCVIDEQPDFLVPPSTLDEYAGFGNGASADLIVNRRCWLGWHGPLPPALAAAAGWHENLFDCPWTIWVDDPDRGALWPYWLASRYAHLLQDLAIGEPCGDGLDPEVVERLRVAEILTTPDAADRRRRAWADVANSCAALFQRGYVPLSGLLPPFHIGALRRYYRYHTRMGTFALGDAQTPGRYVAYDEPTTRFMHQQLTRTISDIVRRVVVPSYSYLALYQGGATLDPHVDREACEYTLSLCIDATPDPQTYGAWPIHLMTADGQVSFTLGIGDALLFRGRELTHWRDQLPAGYTASWILFHFVDLES
jgi:hypothetical protein